MPIFTRHTRLWIVGLTSIAMYGCGPPPDDDDSYSSHRVTTTGALVGPLENDQSDDIVSWVDGQVVTDWAAEIQKRQQARCAHVGVAGHQDSQLRSVPAQAGGVGRLGTRRSGTVGGTSLEVDSRARR